MAETPASPAPAPSTPAPSTEEPAPDAPSAAPAPEAPVAAPASEAPAAPPATTPPAALDATPLPPAVAALDAVDLGEPRVATTLEVPPLPANSGGAVAKPASASGEGTTGAGPGPDGGEWDLLVGKVKTWLEDNDLPGQWERLGGPLRGLGVFLVVLVVLKFYVALLNTLDDLPLLPRLLQLVGLIVVLRFSLLRLTRSRDRQAVLDDWKRRWDAFRGA
ncbi:MAG: CAAD domain-containing protein [Cyanobacteriota bacterium]|nr:CAAD domain-containing protein [Cyanobacteriota bacterium]